MSSWLSHIFLSFLLKLIVTVSTHHHHQSHGGCSSSIYYLNRLLQNQKSWSAGGPSLNCEVLTISCRSLNFRMRRASLWFAGEQSELDLSYFEMLHIKAVVARFSAAVSYDWINRAVAFARTPPLLCLSTVVAAIILASFWVS